VRTVFSPASHDLRTVLAKEHGPRETEECLCPLDFFLFLLIRIFPTLLDSFSRISFSLVLSFVFHAFCAGAFSFVSLRNYASLGSVPVRPRLCSPFLLELSMPLPGAFPPLSRRDSAERTVFPFSSLLLGTFRVSFGCFFFDPLKHPLPDNKPLLFFSRTFPGSQRRQEERLSRASRRSSRLSRITALSVLPLSVHQTFGSRPAGIYHPSYDA